MSNAVVEETVVAAEREIRALRRGSDGPVVLFLHTGAPGTSPFCASSDLFAGLMTTVRLDGHRLVAIDLPGSGGTPALGMQDLLVDGLAQFIGAAVAALGDVGELHLVAHGQVALAALKVARESTDGVHVGSCFLIAPNSAAPVGDSIQNVSLLHPPTPMWGKRSQRWALRRLAYAPDRVPPSILERMIANAETAPHIQAVELMRDPVNASALFGSQLRAQDEFYAYCRDERYKVPITIFWGAQDPTATAARGTVLADILCGGPAALEFNLANQCGHLAQFDRPYQLARTIETAVLRASARPPD